MTPTVLLILHYDGSFPIPSAARSSVQERILLPQLHFPNSSSWYRYNIPIVILFLSLQITFCLTAIYFQEAFLLQYLQLPEHLTSHCGLDPLGIFLKLTYLFFLSQLYFTMPSTDLKNHSQQGNRLHPDLPKTKRRQQKMRKRTSNLQR